MWMSLEQLCRRMGISYRTAHKYLRAGLIPEHLTRREEMINHVQAWRIHEDAIPWFERILHHNLEKIHGCNPSLWAVRKYESDRKRGLVE